MNVPSTFGRIHSIEHIIPWITGKKDEGKHASKASGQQASKPKSIQESVTVFPDIWWAICGRSTAIEDLDVGKVATKLKGKGTRGTFGF